MEGETIEAGVPMMRRRTSLRIGMLLQVSGPLALLLQATVFREQRWLLVFMVFFWWGALARKWLPFRYAVVLSSQRVFLLRLRFSGPNPKRLVVAAARSECHADTFRRPTGARVCLRMAAKKTQFLVDLSFADDAGAFGRAFPAETESLALDS